MENIVNKRSEITVTLNETVKCYNEAKFGTEEVEKMYVYSFNLYFCCFSDFVYNSIQK